jgi:hypothetical protein
MEVKTVGPTSGMRFGRVYGDDHKQSQPTTVPNFARS